MVFFNTLLIMYLILLSSLQLLLKIASSVPTTSVSTHMTFLATNTGNATIMLRN